MMTERRCLISADDLVFIWAKVLSCIEGRELLYASKFSKAAGLLQLGICFPSKLSSSFDQHQFTVSFWWHGVDFQSVHILILLT